MHLIRHDSVRSQASPWRLRRRLKLATLCLLGIVMVTTPDVQACGPWLPEEILTSRQVILRTPVGDFAQEVVALTPADGAPALPDGLDRLPFQSLDEGDEQNEAPAPSSEKRELAELRSALDQKGTSADQREKILSAYEAFRAGLLKKPVGATDDPDPPVRFDVRARQIRRLAAQPVPANPVLPPLLSDGLPGEWVDYLAGAAAFWQNDLSGARAAWERLLARPQNERLYCSTWAAYMLARISDAPEAPSEESAARYKRVRDLRAAGCRDLFNLASASLGWEARLALDRRDCSTAIRLYYLQAITSGDNLGVLAGSFRAVVLAVLPEVGPDPADSARLATAANDPFLRRVITLYLACHRFFGEDETETMVYLTGRPAGSAAPPVKSAVVTAQESWFAALSRDAVDSVPEAAMLAWAAYQGGYYAEAAAWLTKAPAEDGLALWLRAKLALRDGKTDAAAGFFAQAVHSYPVEIRDISNTLDSATELAADGRAFRANQFQADLGVISLSRGDYAQALTALLRSGFWRDAAYVAERVMTVDELLGYVRANFPHTPPAAEPVKQDATPAPDESPAPTPSVLEVIQERITVDHSANPAAYDTRYLLARRLSRAGRYGEAREFYPAALLPKFDEYAAARKFADSARQPAAKRADALWRAARIERWLGMELFGSEDDPDWFVENGVYDEDSHYREARLDLPAPDGCDPGAAASREELKATPAPAWIPSISEEEKRRVADNPVVPEKRFHYRYLAADLAWKAATLMPNQQERTALVLAAGGRWLTSMQDDKGADRFYLAILHRCGQTVTGREALRLGAIPPLSDETF
jgi:tetratricopeptide (TPR) repeat protein